MHLFYTPDIAHSNELPADEAAHALRVLRLKVGDELTLTDGMGCFYRAEIAVADNKHCLVNVLETLPQPALWKGHLHLALAPTKNMDRMEWLAEKATEIGFDELTFLNCRYSERRVIKLERIEKIVVSAVKQSLKARMPQQWSEVHCPLLSWRKAPPERHTASRRRCLGTHRPRRRFQ